MKSSQQPTQTVSFLKFWHLITDNLGDSHGSIDPQTKTTQQLFSTFDDQLGLLKEIIIDSYSLNKCHHIKSHIDVNSVLDILGKKAFELHVKQADDLLDIELLEEICWLICQHYRQSISMPVFVKKEHDEQLAKTRDKAKVFSLSKTKVRIANSKL